MHRHGATTEMTIQWQGVRLRHPKDESSDGWGTFTSSRGTFVVRSRRGRLIATPMSVENPGPDINTANDRTAGLIINAQTVTLKSIAGVWMGKAHISDQDLEIEDPRP